MGAGYVSATSEVVVVSADRALALPSTRPRRALRNNVLKMLQLRRFCVTLACNIPGVWCQSDGRAYPITSNGLDDLWENQKVPTQEAVARQFTSKTSEEQQGFEQP